MHPNGSTPTLAPAYDVVAYAAFHKNHGHALQLLPRALLPRVEQREPGRASKKQMLSPATVRAFCAALGIPEKPAMAVLREAAKKAFAACPKMIRASLITPAQKRRLLEQFNGHAVITSLKRRA